MTNISTTSPVTASELPGSGSVSGLGTNLEASSLAAYPAVVGLGADPAESTVSAKELKKRSKKPFGFAFWFFVSWLGIVLICAIFGKLLPFAGKAPDYITASYINDGKAAKVFGWAHPLGTDQNGNDWLSAAVEGSRNSMVLAFATIFFGFLVGGGLGMIAGYRRGRLDAIFTFFTTVLLSIPPLLFIILLLTIFAATAPAGGVAQGLQTTVWKLSFSLGVLSIPTLYRVVRASTMQFASREFVVAARAMGAKPSRVLLKEILPNVAKPMLAYGLVAAAGVISVEGGLSFLGIGVGDKWAWGKMISTGNGIKTLKGAPMITLVPVIILFLTVMGFNFVGDKLRERLEVKQGGI
jgi:peptide/nickel transport system permease protein